ncbi:winged helix DNA-binding domain-containing protein [Kribbella sp. NPDC051770]|uniref:winged helix DNA-binding domain-containing protein n=1 Tax=Kribbella sp. NPDC051770 TaxID=3155413 RepID=UPI00342D70C3
MVRQLLVEREELSVAEAVKRMVAVQAQHPASPYVALFNRVVGFDPGELDAAFTAGVVVKATLMRMTLHAVHADEHAAFRAAIVPMMNSAQFQAAFAAGGVSEEEAHALGVELAAFAKEPRLGAEFEEWLNQRLGTGGTEMWWAMRAVAPLLHAPTGGPWSFGQRPAFIAASSSPAAPARGLELVTRRYLEGFGPASIADIAQFVKVTRGRVKTAVAALDLEELEGPDGKILYDVPGGARPDDDLEVPPRLMAMWDSVLLAYDDRGRVVPPEYKRVITRNNGDVLPTLLADGYVAGVWRPVEDGIEATAFRKLPAAAWKGLRAEARDLFKILRERDPRVYRRYDYWWKHLPAAEVKVLKG